MATPVNRPAVVPTMSAEQLLRHLRELGVSRTVFSEMLVDVGWRVEPTNIHKKWRVPPVAEKLVLGWLADPETLPAKRTQTRRVR